ncbi:MAG: S9 family peptidase [Fibrobacteres bacterium]|nr:S9 family peptidase [Fibrobacterota bacterium]
MNVCRFLLISILTFSVVYAGSDLHPPKAEKKLTESVIFDKKIIDNYDWLDDKESPTVINYLNAENEYCSKYFSNYESLQESLFSEMKRRVKPQEEGLPLIKNGYGYYSRYESGKEYRIFCRKKDSAGASEEIILDVNKIAEGKKYCVVADRAVSSDNKLMAYAVDTIGKRKHIIYIKNLETGSIYNETISNTNGKIVWGNDNKTIYYLLKDSTLRASRVFRHTTGDDISADSMIYFEKDKTLDLQIAKSKSGQFILLNVMNGQRTVEVRYLNADFPKDTFKAIEPRAKNIEYSADHFGTDFIIRTNYNAVNFRVVKMALGSTGKSSWIEVVPHRDDVFIEAFEIFKNFLVINERKDGLMQMRVKSWNNDTDYYLSFPEKTFYTSFAGNPEINSNLLRYTYTSLTTPRMTYDFDMNTKEQKLLKEEAVAGGYDKSQYECDRITVTARDGAKVPVSIVYKKGFKKNWKAPMLIHSYGAYGAMLNPVFRSERISLLDRGFVFAIAHVRGGEDLGRKWYDGGRMFNKKNTFNDYIDCAKALIKQGYTSGDRLFGKGESAGGLLMGAVANAEPDLFKGLIACVPFMNVIHTMLDSTLPLVTFEYEEWGNPAKKEEFDYMFSYSPYENIKKQKYPSMLVTGGFHDSQVPYWDPAKWVAKLREMKMDENPLLLNMDMSSGHDGSSGRYNKYKAIAMEYAFLITQIEH